MPPGLKYGLFLVCVGVFLFCFYRAAVGVIDGAISIPLKHQFGALVLLEESPIAYVLCVLGWMVLTINAGYLAWHFFHRKTKSGKET